MRLLTAIVVLLASAHAFGQDAHYTYPFTLSCPEGVVAAGETFSVRAVFEGGHTGERYEPDYSWSLSQGRIVSGQGTKEVRIQLDAELGDLATVTLNREFLKPHFPGVQRDATCQIAVAARPAARMTDEFRTAGDNCEDGLTRLDAFLLELNNDPGAAGMIVLYTDLAAQGAARVRQLQLFRYARFRGFDLSRLTFVRGVPRESGTTQFWIVPIGADRPSIETAPLIQETRPKLPYMHSADHSDGMPECNEYDYDLGDYARILNMEPKARARVIISESSKAKFNSKLKEVITQLAANGVTRDRIIGVYKYVRPSRLLESTELWVIPGRRSR